MRVEPKSRSGDQAGICVERTRKKVSRGDATLGTDQTFQLHHFRTVFLLYISEHLSKRILTSYAFRSPKFTDLDATMK